MRLEGQRALITGGLRGIGRSVSEVLAREGADIAFTYNSSQGASEWAEQLGSHGGRSMGVRMDVTCQSDIEEGIKRILDEWGGIEILVNNAGITKDNILPRIKEDDWNDVINTNLSGPFKTSQRAIKHMMKNKWGRIVFISSIVGIIGNQGQANYAASKAGLIGLSKSIAKEMGSRNITSNVIAPGYIETDMTAFLTDEQKDNIIEQLSIKRIGKPEDIANIVSFLCTDESEYITGQVISVDGGITS